MRSQLAKSLYIGLAAMSLGAVATVSVTSTSADAAAKAKIVSKSALGKDSKNVEVTGTNAIYSKPGTVSGARLVASKSTVKKLANSNHSSDYFRAYHMAVTNRGTVYYKIVSMNGKYRGYIYGGKVKGTLAAGLREAATVKEAKLPTKTTGYHIKDVKKNTLWTAPKGTTYKAHKVSMYGSSKSDSFVVSKAETKTKEGSLYYYVTSTANPEVAGWIFAGKGYDATATTQDLGGLSMTTSAATATDNNSVTVTYIGTNGNSVGKSTFVTEARDTKQNAKVQDAEKNVKGQSLKDFIGDMTNAPAGFKLTSTADQIAAAASSAVYGGTVRVNVVKAATSKISFFLASTDGVSAGVEVKADSLANGKPAITTDQAKSLTDDASKSIIQSDGHALTDKFFAKSINSKLLTASANLSGYKNETDTTAVTIEKGKKYYVSYTYNQKATNKANQNAKFGDTIKVVLDQKNILADNLPSTGNTNNSTTDY